MKIRSLIHETPAAAPDAAVAYFARRFSYETDCADVHSAISRGRRDFVLLDVRTPELYATGHVPGAINMPRASIDAEALSEFPADTLFVVYCAGPHCNGAQRSALRIAQLGRPVKEMIGGVTGWIDEGLDLERP